MRLIRIATEDDAREILDIYAPYITDTSFTFELDVPTIPEFKNRINNYLETYPWLVYEIDGEINLDEITNKVEELISRKRTVIVSNFSRHNKLAQYLAQCKPKRVIMLLNIANLVNIFNAKNFGDNYARELLSYISGLFSKNVKLYAFPHYSPKEGKLLTIQNMPSSPEAKSLFDFLIANGYVKDVESN